MAKDKTRDRSLPEWIKQRTTVTIRQSAHAAAYYQREPAKLMGWYDVYGAYRQGARVRA